MLIQQRLLLLVRMIAHDEYEQRAEYYEKAQYLGYHLEKSLLPPKNIPRYQVVISR